MRLLVLLLAATFVLPAQTQLSPDETTQLTTRILQLMESTAVAIPGLPEAAAPVQQSARAAIAQLQRSPLEPAPTWRFMLQIKAYLALADSFPRPDSFPSTAAQQFTELRDSLDRLGRHFETLLTSQNQAVQQRDADPNNLKQYAEADTKMVPLQPGQPRVVFLGDSTTEGWPLNEYFTGRDFVNRGIRGQTTLQMIARFRQDVAALKPKAVVILAGFNDIAMGISADQIEQNLATLADLAKAHNIKPVFASILSVGADHNEAPAATIQAIDEWLKNFCQTQKFMYVDYYSATADASGQLQPDLADDGLHPNSKGYRVMAPIALDAINHALGVAVPAKH